MLQPQKHWNHAVKIYTWIIYSIYNTYKYILYYVLFVVNWLSRSACKVRNRTECMKLVIEKIQVESESRQALMSWSHEYLFTLYCRSQDQGGLVSSHEIAQHSLNTEIPAPFPNLSLGRYEVEKQREMRLEEQKKQNIQKALERCNLVMGPRQNDVLARWDIHSICI